MRAIQRGVMVAFLSFFLGGCTLNYTAKLSGEAFQALKLKEEHRVTRSSKWVLHGETRLFIAAPEVFNTRQYDHVLPRTKYRMYLSFLNAFSRAFPSVISDENVWDVDVSLAQAKAANAQILMVPSLQLMINTENGLSDYEAGQIDDPDQLYPLDTTVIRVALYDVTSGKLMDVVSIDSRAKLFSSKHYSLSTFIDRAAMSLSCTLSGLPLAPFG